jgi:hypothetical protein
LLVANIFIFLLTPTKKNNKCVWWKRDKRRPFACRGKERVKKKKERKKRKKKKKGKKEKKLKKKEKKKKAAETGEKKKVQRNNKYRLHLHVLFSL